MTLSQKRKKPSRRKPIRAELCIKRHERGFRVQVAVVLLADGHLQSTDACVHICASGLECLNAYGSRTGQWWLLSQHPRAPLKNAHKMSVCM